MNRTTASWITELRAACLPFVTRTLRGPRLRRSVALSLLLALVTCVLGAWIATGDGELERESRRVLRLEKSAQQRAHEDFVLYAYDPQALARLESERDDLWSGGPLETHYGELRGTVALANETLRTALGVQTIPKRHEELYERARALADRQPDRPNRLTVGRATAFDWNRPRDVTRLQAIVEHELVPGVELYRSPIGPLQAVAIVGLLAGLLLTLLMTVVVPVLVGIAVAQESHENTLQPLCGTSLSPRQIAIGLLVGAAAPVLIIAVPQLAVAAVAAVITGSMLPFLAFFGLLLPCTWVLVSLAQVVGLQAGKRRGPGMIGITLLAMASVWTIAGLVLGFQTGGGTKQAAMMALLPSGALGHFLHEAFLGDTNTFTREGHELWFAGRLATAVFACVVLGVLGMLATERRILGRYAPPLRRGEAVLGVGVLALLTLLAAPGSSTELWMASLAMMVMPMQIFVTGRVPIGDAPAGTTRVPLAPLLGEFAAFVGIHAVIAILVLGPGWLDQLQPIASLQLAWGLAVAALVSIRVVAMPAPLPVLVWAGFAYMVAIITFGTGIGNMASQMRSAYPSSEILFVLWKASPMLGLVQAALTIAIPILLVRALARPAAARPPGDA